MRKNYKKDIKGLLENLCNLAEPYKINYKVMWEYRYYEKRHRIYVNRIVVVFKDHSPILTKYFNDELELIQYLIEQISKYNCND